MPPTKKVTKMFQRQIRRKPSPDQKNQTLTIEKSEGDNSLRSAADSKSKYLTCNRASQVT
jgi:hypothetical protein